MQQLGFHAGIGAHCQREPSLWAGQPSGALDEFAPQGAKLLELPQWRALFGGVPFLFITTHLHLPAEVMCQRGREEIDLIAGLFAGRHVVHLGLRLEFGENTLLGAASIMEAQRLPGVSFFALMEPPVFGVKEPLFSADYQARTGVLFS